MEVPRRTEGVVTPGARVTGRCEIYSMGAGNQTWDLWQEAPLIAKPSLQPQGILKDLEILCSTA